MRNLIDLDTYPLDQPDSLKLERLIMQSKDHLRSEGLFNLPGFIRSEALEQVVDELEPILDSSSFTHARRHNIYFKPEIKELDPTHPALTEFETSNRTICADKMGSNAIIQLYEWPPFIDFLAAVMDRSKLFTMADHLARTNVMGYSGGQALNWHFDRSEFTTTLLLQAPTAGGKFEYAKDLRSDKDPNYQGVADLILGKLRPLRIELEPGTLNVFKGKNTAHRVTPVQGDQDRIIAVFSYFDQPGVQFSNEERIGFYGRSA